MKPFYALMVACSLCAWLGGASPLFMRDPNVLRTVGIVSVVIGGVVLLLFRTKRFLDLVSSSSPVTDAGKVHRVLTSALAVVTIVIFAIVIYRMHLGEISGWKNVWLMPAALFFLHAAGWLSRRPRFARDRK